MTEEQVLKLIQDALLKQVGSGASFSSLYPYVLVVLLGYMLGRLTSLHNDLKDYFGSVKSFLSSIDRHLRGE